MQTRTVCGAKAPTSVFTIPAGSQLMNMETSFLGIQSIPAALFSLMTTAIKLLIAAGASNKQAITESASTWVTARAARSTTETPPVVASTPTADTVLPVLCVFTKTRRTLRNAAPFNKTNKHAAP
jgi:hypothetical protein